jgi:hypothetical protein
MVGDHITRVFAFAPTPFFLWTVASVNVSVSYPFCFSDNLQKYAKEEHQWMLLPQMEKSSN